MVPTPRLADKTFITPNQLFFAWKDDVVNVRDLHRERKYRKCAVLCSELLETAKHPVHRIFLLFYQAVCYESLGHIAHNYSTNKIPLLEQARDATISASETLPLPFLTQLGGRYDTPGTSPECPTFDMLALYGNDSPSIYPPTTPGSATGQRERSVSNATSSTIRPTDRISVAYTVPNFDDYSPRQSFNKGTPLKEESSKQFLTPNEKIGSNHKARLSRSLSSQHTLAGDLVPSPLFSRVPSSKKESQFLSKTYASSLPLVTLSKPLPPTPINRHLPALPFNHQPEFVLKGKRFLLVPRRKTALATLISKFEGKTPFDSPSPDNENIQPVPAGPTPTTKRFNRISAVFSEKDVLNEVTNQQNLSRPAMSWKRNSITTIVTGKEDHQVYPLAATPKTPCPRPKSLAIHHPPPSSVYSMSSSALMTPPLSPDSHLVLYDTHLSSIRTAIKTQIASISEQINSVRAIQLAHEDEKRQRFANMHSRQSSFIPSPTKSKAQRDSRITPVKDARLRSFWSLQIAGTNEIARRAGLDAQKAQERQEKIKRLKAEGWKSVRKESKGWKGARYYEELRREVEAELMCY